jgi:hypothetical protein
MLRRRSVGRLRAPGGACNVCIYSASLFGPVGVLVSMPRLWVHVDYALCHTFSFEFHCRMSLNIVFDTCLPIPHASHLVVYWIVVRVGWFFVL